jgi:hypothetical protein
MGLELQLHAAGLAELIRAFGQPFTVDGVAGTFRGLLDNPIVGLSHSVEAGQEQDGGTLYSKREASFTPISGMRVTIRSRHYTIDQVTDEQGHWAMQLIGRNR